MSISLYRQKDRNASYFVSPLFKPDSSDNGYKIIHTPYIVSVLRKNSLIWRICDLYDITTGRKRGRYCIMDINDFKSKNGLNLACFVSGTVFSILTFFVFKEISSMEMFNFLDKIENTFTFVFLNFSLLAITFIIGFLIQGIRYLGFNYYITIWQKAQPGRHAGKKYPSIRQRILFYIFRNGTVVEECLDGIMVRYDNDNKTPEMNKSHKKNMDKRYRPIYDWIQASGNKADKDMWIHATKINRVAPQDDVYRFYNWSEVFQCLDTTFLFFTVTTPILIFLNVFDRFLNSRFHSNKIFLIVMFLSCLILHIVSKGCAKMYARRFLYQIEKSLKSYKILIDENETKLKSNNPPA
jgi:hypothetical protein